MVIRDDMGKFSDAEEDDDSPKEDKDEIISSFSPVAHIESSEKDDSMEEEKVYDDSKIEETKASIEESSRRESAMKKPKITPE